MKYLVRDLPVINENCPACFEEPKERARTKTLLASQEHIHPNLFSNLLKYIFILEINKINRYK